MAAQSPQSAWISRATALGSTYSARTTELIYRHIRKSLQYDDDINQTIEKIMQQRPPENFYFRPRNARPHRRTCTLKRQSTDSSMGPLPNVGGCYIPLHKLIPWKINESSGQTTAGVTGGSGSRIATPISSTS